MKLYRHPNRDSWQEIVSRPSRANSDVANDVRPIFEAVRRRGDDAVREYARRFDKIELDTIRVTDRELDEASGLIPDPLKEAIELAAENIRRFHSAYVEEVTVVETMPGVRCWRKNVPIESVGLYVPGGSAPLFSTVLMLGIPASIAGCRRIVLATPALSSGMVHPAVLHAANRVGISEVHRVGGAQAIAALALGTRTIPRVDKILGPGNQYVTAAKLLAVREGVAIDMPAGPTEVAIIADATCQPRFVACDILSQAEHGTDSHVLFVSDDDAYVNDVMQELEQCLADLPRKAIAAEALKHSGAVVTTNLEEALDLVNMYAPEHLVLAVREPDELADRVTNAGSVFVGSMSPEAAGDYATGTNHTLPTNGHARAYSGVSVDSFVKKITFQRLTPTGLKNVGPAVSRMAEAEGLTGHARSITARLESI